MSLRVRFAGEKPMEISPQPPSIRQSTGNLKGTLKRFIGSCVSWVLPGLSRKLSPAEPSAKGVLLEDLTWLEAEKVLTPNAIVVLPLGAASKEHGPHLKLKNDWLLAEYFKNQVLQKAPVVMAPTLNYHYYPAFVEYPGSTTLRLETARDMTVDVVRSLARFGPKRFYVLNTGVSTLRALQPAADILAKEGIRLQYTDVLKAYAAIEKTLAQQEGGTHADELETSKMLYIAPETVDMTKAVKDYHPGRGPLTRNPNGPGAYSPSGVFGDATLATWEKGKILTAIFLDTVLRDLENLQKQPK